MKKIITLAIFLLLISACSAQTASEIATDSGVQPTVSQPTPTQGPTPLPLLPEVDLAAGEQLRTRGQVQIGEQACNFGQDNPLPQPDIEPLAFAEGTWRVESTQDMSAFGGSGTAESVAVASIENVAGNGFVEYYAGGWGGQVYFETTFWGSAGSRRWAVVETNTSAQALSSLYGTFKEDAGFVTTGEMFGRRVELSLLPIDADSFDWQLSDAGSKAVIWARHYTRLNNESEITLARQYALGGLQSLPANEDLAPISFWIGEWNWYEHHIDLGRECAEGQAAVTYTNGGQAIEERVVSSYDPAEAGTETYTDYSLAVYNPQTQKFEVYWWTNGAVTASFYEGVCATVGDQKECQLRAAFRPSADENSIEWEHSGGTRIDWERKQ